MTAPLFLSGAALIDLALRGTLLIGGAWLAAVALRRAGASAAARHMAWLLGIFALLALPLLWWLLPPLRLPVLRPEIVTAAATSFLVPAAAAAPSLPGWERVLLAVWLLGVATVLLRLAYCRHLVFQLWRDAGPARDPAWQDMLARLLRETKMSRRVALRIARGPAMPMTWGTLAPKLLLPAEARAWSPDRRRLVLLHELAHVARHDSLSRSAASLACALYWFHPGAWLAARWLRLEQEHAADDRVLNAGAPARNYARNLLELARRADGKTRPDHAAAMAGTCQLERRLLSITTPGSREDPGPALLSAAVAIATCVLLAVATGVPVRPLTAIDPLWIDSGPRPIAGASAEEPSAQGAQLPDRVRAAPLPSGRPRDFRDGSGAPRATAPLPRADGTEGRQSEPAGRVQETVPAADAALRGNGQDLPASPPLGSYGPQWQQPVPEERASDPRIPAALRQAGAGRGDGQGQPGATGRSLRSWLWRLVPRAVPQPVVDPRRTVDLQ